MLKKAHLHNPSKITCAENGQICCSVCKNKSKSMYYLCKSRRHVICEDCNGSESVKNRNDDGDNIPDKECDTSGAKEVSYILSSKTKRQNFASGDHIETVESFKITSSKTQKTKSSSPKSQSKNNVETSIKYVNDNYNDSQSSIASSSILLSKSTSKEEQHCERVARPVRCPVTNCSRMVIINSFFQHFNFDHSRVPRMVLDKNVPQEFLITYSTLSSETNCVAILVLPQEIRINQTSVKKTESFKSLPGLGKTDELNLLMAARLQISSVKQYGTRNGSIRNQFTQTGYLQSKNKQKKVLKMINNSGNIENVPNKDNKDEILLLWLCSLDNKEKTFTVTISRTDKKQGYSYIGSGIHIKEQQDPLSIYNRQECLSVRKIAIDKLLLKNELKILVSIVQ